MLLPSGDDRSDPIWGTMTPIWGALPDAMLRFLGDDDLVTPIDEEGEQSAPHTGQAGRIDSLRPTSRGRRSEPGRIVRYPRSTSSASIRRSVDLQERFDRNEDDGAPHSHGYGQVSVVWPDKPWCNITN